MTDIYVYYVSSVFYEQLSSLLMSYYTIYTFAYLENSPTSLRIRTSDLSLASPTRYQDASRRWLIAYDLVFINKQIYSFRHNMNNLIKYFSLTQSCILIKLIKYFVLFSAFIYNENHSKQKNCLLLYSSLSVVYSLHILCFTTGAYSINPAYLAIFLHAFTSGWGKTPHRSKMNYLMHMPLIII